MSTGCLRHMGKASKFSSHPTSTRLICAQPRTCGIGAAWCVRGCSNWLNAFEKEPDLASIRGYVEDSGEGRWTVLEAIEKDVPAHCNAFASNASSFAAGREFRREGDRRIASRDRRTCGEARRMRSAATEACRSRPPRPEGVRRRRPEVAGRLRSRGGGSRSRGSLLRERVVVRRRRRRTTAERGGYARERDH